MQHAEVIQKMDEILVEAGFDPAVTTIATFLDKAHLVVDIIKEWPKEKKEEPWLVPFARKLRELEGEFSKIVERDPMILYRPAHQIALDFHSSDAFIRYFKGGNRTSKTMSGYAEHYFVLTGQHKWRKFAQPPTATFIVGVNFMQYAPSVFEKKFITGEPGNLLTPIFPEGGKWLYKYDSRKHIIYICCEKCAEAGKAQDCPHPKSTTTLFSDTEGAVVLQGGQYNLGHYDESVRKEFFSEGIQRLQTVPHSGLIVTGTPLLGKSAWEYQLLTCVARDKKKNRYKSPTEPDKWRQYVSVHQISQKDAGLFPSEQIEASLKTMDPLEAEARVYGREAPLAKNSVFDRFALYDMENGLIEPEYVDIDIASSKVSIESLVSKDELKLTSTQDGNVHLWELPKEDKQYIIGCDVAAGLSGGDYSCASVLTIPDLELVAQYHGHVNPLKYAEEIVKLATFYNNACVVVERTGGLGVATLTRLKEIGYWNLFRDLSDPSAAEYNPDSVLGVDTNIKTKGHMISCLQQVIKERSIKIPCAATLEELRAFGQERTEAGLNYRFRGESGAHDDRVMSLVVAVYVAVTYSVYDFSSNIEGLKSKYEDPIWKDLHRELELEQRLRRDAWA